MTIPNKLKKGSHIRIISPSTSLAVITEEQREIASKRLQDLGFQVSFSKNAEELTTFGSSSIKSRVEDLHEAFADQTVDGILTTLGGFNSNQLLSYLDFELIKKNPKVFCGYSDITALSAAIYAKTGLITYSGPHFSSFSMLKGAEYTIDYFKKCVIGSEVYSATSSSLWSDDQWYLDQVNRTFIENEGWLVIQEGEAQGLSVGGNLCTFNLIQGTEYFPKFEEDIILFVEDDYMSIPETFDRDLQSLLHVSSIKENIKGLVIGRFQKKSNMSVDSLKEIIRSKRELSNIPVIANANFGHVSPFFTFPFGGIVSIQALKERPSITLITH